MKVPSLVTTDVTQNAKPLAYTQPASNVGAAGAMIGQALQGFGGAVTKIEERQKQTDKFNALTKYNDFETDAMATQTELKRNSPPDAQGFTKTAEAVFDKKAEDFITKNIPPDLQEEFRYKASETRQKLMGDAFKFQYEAGDAWFRKGIDDQLNKARTEIDQNPGSLPTWQKKMDDVINATDLSEIEKQGLREQVQISLASTDYRAAVRRDKSESLKLGVGDFSTGEQGAFSLITHEEGFRATPYWDTNAWRIGYGSDTVTLADGTTKKVVPGMVITKEDAQRDFQYRISQREGKAVREQIGDKWNELPPNVQAALYSVGYNYGSLPIPVVNAVRSGDMTAVATAVGNLEANKSRRQREAAIISGGKALELDPKYSVIPFDDRVKLRDDAERDAAAEYKQQQAQEEADRKAKLNGLMTSIHDGTAGAKDIQDFRDNGILTDIDDITKAEALLGKRDKDQNLAIAGWERYGKGETWDPTDADQKKQIDAMIGPDGLDKLDKNDNDYFHNQVVPIIDKTGLLPGSVSGLLQGMVRSSNQTKAAWALDALAQIRDINPGAYANAIPDDVEQQVNRWDTLKDVATDRSELLRSVQGNPTAAERQNQAVLMKQGQEILSKVTNGIPHVNDLIKDVVGSYDKSYFGANPHISVVPVVAQSLWREFQTTFLDEYSKTGNETLATDSAKKILARNWGVNPVGDGTTIMKYPIDKVGYMPGADGTYDWVDSQIRNDLKIGANKYEMFSDDQTREEYQKFQSGQIDHPPSYRIFTIDEFGIPRERLDEKGQPLRMYFQKTETDKKRDSQIFDWRQEDQLVRERLADIAKMKTESTYTGQELPKEILDEEETLRKNLDGLQKADPRKRLEQWNDEMGLPAQPTDAMGN